jgi:methyl-accepting chemotaxis protein
MSFSTRNVEIVSQLNAAMAEQEVGSSEILKATRQLLWITEEVTAAIQAQKSAIDEFNRSLMRLEETTRNR